MPRDLIWKIAMAAGSIVMGLSAIRWAAENLDAFGTLGFIIAMTPFILLFEYSVPLPSYFVIVGLAMVIVAALNLRKQPSHTSLRPLGTFLWIAGLCLIGLSILIFVGASIYYNVGQGPAPAAWSAWVQPGSCLGEVGIVTAIVGILIRNSKFASLIQA